MQPSFSCSVLLAALLLAPAPAGAQGWNGRFLIGANAVMQTTSSTFEDDFTYAHPYTVNIPGEEASVQSRYEVPTGVLFDGGAAVRLIGNLGAGVAASISSRTGDLAITARIPHPLLIASHRAVEGTVAARHEEVAVHVNAVYVVPASARLHFALSGGPTYFRVEQRLAKTVSVSEAYPYDTATFSNAQLEPERESGWGFNAAVDLAWMFRPHFGVGGLLRYSRATLTLSPTGRQPRDIEVGGLNAGAGARISF
ncbi:MAG TPA: hypothetical protein VK886_10155 [Vicinamibacterales bacterium]|nr:hypothetical protein [Vicinamibacterales bacterium]